MNAPGLPNIQIQHRYLSTLNGSESIRLAVAVALIDANSRILLELRSDVLHWGITGGQLEVGEDPLQCGIREIKEETGITLNTLDLVLIDVYGNPEDNRILQYSDNRYHLVDILYVARFKSSEHLILSNESKELKFFNALSIPSRIVPPAFRIINDLIRAKLIL